MKDYIQIGDQTFMLRTGIPMPGAMLAMCVGCVFRGTTPWDCTFEGDRVCGNLYILVTPSDQHPEA